jgi:hypothetical protein
MLSSTWTLIVWWAWGTPVKGPFSQWCSLKGMVTETCDSHERGFKSGKAINEEREKESKKVLIEDSIEVSSHNVSLMLKRFPYKVSMTLFF